MSFGFGIGDFITVADRAWAVYQKCASASSDYKELARYVQILRYTLLDVQKVFPDDTAIPAYQPGQAALAAARNGCVLVLDEVEGVLVKHAGMASAGKKRIIDRAKFITKDIEGLNAKLRHNAELLQLALASLNSLSVRELQKQLELIHQEYRGGRREATVITEVILDHRRVDKEEVLEQIIADLEDKDVHPDSINLNQAFIQSWVASIVEEGGLEESVDEEDVDWKETVDSVADTLQEQHITESSPGLRYVTKFGDERAAPDTLPLSPSSQTSPDPSVWDSVSIAQTTEATWPRSSTPPVVGVAWEHAGQNMGRSNSVSSHASKAEDWHPSNRPDPQYVHAMLVSLLQPNFWELPSPENVRLRITRAFNQQDWTHQGQITRAQCLQLVKDVLDQAAVKIDANSLKDMVRRSDANRDNYLDRNEFGTMIQELIWAAALAKEEQLAELLKTMTEAPTGSTPSKPDHQFLPWGWSFSASGQYVDMITGNTDTETKSDVSIANHFGLKAFEAERYVQKITTFQQRWLGIVPLSLQMKYSLTLERVNAAATSLIMCEAQESQAQFSDLDTVYACLNICAKLAPDDPAFKTSDLDRIRSLQKLTTEMLQLIQGFCVQLEDFDKLPATTQNFPEFNRLWNVRMIEAFAQLIEARSRKWSIRTTVSDIRQAGISHGIEPVASTQAQKYMSARYAHILEIEQVIDRKIWTGTVEELVYTGSKPPCKKSFTSIGKAGYVCQFSSVRPYSKDSVVYHPERYSMRQATKIAEIAPSMTWHFSLTFPVSADSVFWIVFSDQRGQDEWKSSCNTSEYVRVDAKSFNLDFKGREAATRTIRVPMGEASIKITLSVPGSEFAPERTRLLKCHWTMLTRDGQLEEHERADKFMVDFPVEAPKSRGSEDWTSSSVLSTVRSNSSSGPTSPLSTAETLLSAPAPMPQSSVDASDPLPPNWEKRTTREGQTYYVDHDNRITTWKRPSSQTTSPSLTAAPSATAVPNGDGLPSGWEMRTLPGNGRPYYVDHNTRTTTYTRPSA